MAQFREFYHLGTKSIETERSTVLQFGNYSLDMASYIEYDEGGNVLDKGR